MPRSQNASPIVRETTALYGIKSESLKKYKCRIGKKPFFYFVDQIEAIDLDEYLDFKIESNVTKGNFESYEHLKYLIIYQDIFELKRPLWGIYTSNKKYLVKYE